MVASVKNFISAAAKYKRKGIRANISFNI